MSDNSSITLAKDTDYTVDLGGLDLNTLGTYTITFTKDGSTYWQTMGFGPLCTFTIYTISE